MIYIEREENKTQILQQIWVRAERWMSSPTTEVTCRDPTTCRRGGAGGGGPVKVVQETEHIRHDLLLPDEGREDWH